MCVIPWLPCLQWYSEGLKGGCISTMSLWGRTATGEDVRTRQIWTRFSPHLCWLWFSFPKCANTAWLIQILHSVWLWLHCSVSTCELLHRLQPDTDGLVGEQRGGGQRAWHALHYANVLHALGHGERGHSVVSLEGTVAVYAATCRMGGEDKAVWEAFPCVQQCIRGNYNTASGLWRSVWIFNCEEITRQKPGIEILRLKKKKVSSYTAIQNQRQNNNNIRTMYNIINKQ